MKTIIGTYSLYTNPSPSGGGNGGGNGNYAPSNGGGGGGGYVTTSGTQTAGQNGANGYAEFSYFDPTLM
jgi:hypothetical protein